jgi:ornithine--oxo-acid transaminase
MNSGYEAVDTAILMARKWGYKVKKVQNEKAKIIFPKHCFWGTMIAARAGSDEKSRRENFEPLATRELMFDFVDFDNPGQLEEKFKSDFNIVAFVFEPIQGHAGNLHPKEGYYKKIRELCTKYNVLMIADEV